MELLQAGHCPAPGAVQIGVRVLNDAHPGLLQALATGMIDRALIRRCVVAAVELGRKPRLGVEEIDLAQEIPVPVDQVRVDQWPGQPGVQHPQQAQA